MAGRTALASLSPGIRLAVARAHASSSMPYFASGLQRLSPVEAPGLGTFGVTDTGFLMYDPETLAKLFADEAATILLHEYLHVFLNHGERFNAMVKRGLLDATDNELWNSACDAEINDDLEAAGLMFPRAEVMGGPATTPQSLGFPVHKMAEEYAALLKKRKQPPPPRPPSGGQGALPACGSASGNPVAGEPDASHPDAQTPLDQHVQRQSDAQQIGEHQKARGKGSVPLGIAQAVEGLLAEPEISWDQELSREVRQSVRSKAGFSDYTYQERSRQQAALDWALGEEAPVLPGMYSPVCNVAIIVDTSGSMYQAIKKVVAEAQGIFRSMGGAKLTMIACDTKVHRMEEIRTVNELKEGLPGGGGSDMRPAFTALQKMPKAKRPNVVVCATDGYVDYPSSTPPEFETIWLCVDGQIGVDWGKTINVDSSEVEE